MLLADRNELKNVKRGFSGTGNTMAVSPQHVFVVVLLELDGVCMRGKEWEEKEERERKKEREK